MKKQARRIDWVHGSGWQHRPAWQQYYSASKGGIVSLRVHPTLFLFPSSYPFPYPILLFSHLPLSLPPFHFAHTP